MKRFLVDEEIDSFFVIHKLEKRSILLQFHDNGIDNWS